MSKEGRLARGKTNYDLKVFLDNSETLEYIATLPKPKIIEDKPKIKENKKDDRSE